METKFSTLSDLKVGSYVIIDGVSCRVVSSTKSKPGKHGAAKVRLEAQGFLDDRRRSIVGSGDTRVEIPIIEKRNAQVISVQEGKATVMDTDSYETFDIDIPEEFKSGVVDGATILYWDLGVKIIKGLK